MHDTEEKEEKYGNESSQCAEEDDFHRYVPVGAYLCGFWLGERFAGQAGGTGNDVSTLPDAEKSCHGDSAYTDALGVTEYVFRWSGSGCDAIAYVNSGKQKSYSGYYNPPNEHTAGTDDGSVF